MNYLKSYPRKSALSVFFICALIGLILFGGLYAKRKFCNPQNRFETEESEVENTPDKDKIIAYHQIYDLFKNYPENNYIGAYGNANLKTIYNGALRYYGIYRKAKIRIIPIGQSDNDIIVKGRLFIFDFLKQDFTGLLTVTEMNHAYQSNNSLNEHGDLIRDSILTNDIRGEFIFQAGNQNEYKYKGDFSICIMKDSVNEWVVAQSGIVLRGDFNDVSLIFGHITPPSSGLFRAPKLGRDKLSINKALLKFGWQSYLYSNPEYFDSVFDIFSDNVEDVIVDEATVSKNRIIENDELK